MISLVEPAARRSWRQPGPGRAGRGDFFAHRDLLSKASNFEYRPQQQQMAVAVARALQAKEHCGGSGHRRGQEPGLSGPGDFVRRGDQRRRRSSPPTPSTSRNSSRKRTCRCSEQVLPVKFSFTMLKGRQNYLCTRRLAQSHAAGRTASSPRRRSRSSAHLRMVQSKPRTAASRILTIEPDPKVWQQVCSERGLCSPKSCGHPSDFAQAERGLFFPARAQPDSFLRRAGAEPHACFSRSWAASTRRSRRRRSLQERFRDL